MSTIDEALRATMAKRELDEHVAAAREEQREACARLFETTPSWEPERAHQEAAFVRSTPLTATPLADTIKDLRAAAESAANVTKTLTEERDAARAALTKISAIRDSIIGTQSFHWSEHAYPLVAVLGAAGFPGASYEIARKNIGTLIEQANAARAELETVRDQAAEALDTFTAALEEMKAEHAARVAELTAALRESQARLVRDELEKQERDPTTLDIIARGRAALSATSEAPTPVCAHCHDTHEMRLGDRTVSCTHCPLPCNSPTCRKNAASAYCDRTPCPCECHAERRGIRLEET